MNTKKIAGLGLLTAIVVVLQALAVMIRPAGGVFCISLVLIPIVIGSALYGWKSGAWLGLVFGIVVLFTDSSAFLAINAPGTIGVVIVKGVCAGIAAALIYSAFSEKSVVLGATLAAIVCPIVNTGIFVIGCRLFYMSAINEWAAAAGYQNAGKYIILGLIGINFIIEMAINILLSSTIVKIIKIRRE